MDYYSDIWYVFFWRLTFLSEAGSVKISSSHRMKTFVVLQLCTPSNFPHIVLAEVAVTNQRASFTTSDQSVVSIIIWSWKENFPLPHENFSQLFVITPPVFLSLFSKKYTGSWRANWLQALSSCQKVYEATSGGTGIRVENVRCLMKWPSFSPSPQESNYLISLSAKLTLLSLSPDVCASRSLPCVQYVLQPPSLPDPR